MSVLPGERMQSTICSLSAGSAGSPATGYEELGYKKVSAELHNSKGKLLTQAVGMSGDGQDKPHREAHGLKPPSRRAQHASSPQSYRGVSVLGEVLQQTGHVCTRTSFV